MKWFNRETGDRDTPEPDDQAMHELLDWHHPRASINDNGRLIIDPGQVLENITTTLERLDNNITTPISIEHDVASPNALVALIQGLDMGALLLVHVANTAMKIMAARYPAELVTSPLCPKYDLREQLSLALSDEQHELAKKIFNRRATSTTDLDVEEISDALENVGETDQLQAFICLFFLYCTKIAAMKHATGIA